MAEEKFMGTFDSETEVLQKIEEMKATGSKEEDMYVMARDKDQISMVRGRTEVDYTSSEGASLMDKFKSFISGDEPTRQAFKGMGLSEEKADSYYREVQNGKILLFVDKEFGASYEGEAPYDNSAYSEPIGTSAVEERPDLKETSSAGYVDTGTVARDGLTVDTNPENDVYYNRSDEALASGESQDPDIDSRETAGVGEDSGTGFGLGSDKKVDDVPTTEHEDLTAEEKLRLRERRMDDRENGGRL